MSDDSSNIEDRLQKKYKSDPTVSLTSNIDITPLAIQKYQDMKNNYNFISFEEDQRKNKKVLTGQFEKYTLPTHDFNQELYRFQTHGYCTNPNPDAKTYVYSSDHPQLKHQVEHQQEITSTHLIDPIAFKTTKQYKKLFTQKYKQCREKSTDALNYLGPWAGYGQNLQNGALTEEQRQLLQNAEERKRVRIQEARKVEQNFQPYSTFHWTKHFDYKNQSYLDAPADYKPEYGNCYIPKKQVQTWIGSQKAGFQVVRFFPKVGHFILVGNAEGKVLLFDVIKDRSLAMTYVGHTKAVRDVQFTNDGKHFLSCGFDNCVQYWDTQYGKVVTTFKLKKIPFCIKFHPESQKQNYFICGSSSKKIVQFDLKTGTKSLTYDQHLGTVNTLTFIQNSKFVSSSDDKKLFVWQFGIPVVIKHVSEPQMHTITSTAMHPSNEYFAGQSSDNQIVIYEYKGGNFRRIRSKKFASHFCAGYACGLDFSHDGQFLVSGDERGRLFFYDWKTSKNYRTLDAHPSVCIGVEWHPSDPTKVVTCGWEGLVKLWQ